MISQMAKGFALAVVLCSGSLYANDLPPIWMGADPPPAFCDPSSICNINVPTERWTWQMFPDGFIYPTYLAAVQPRLGGVWNYDKNYDWMWDITLGGRAPLLRYGNKSQLFPEGWQLDMEGSVHLRLHLIESMDMEANDFRFGLPISYCTKIWQFRTGYQHISSHMGDERIIRFHPDGDPAIPRTGNPFELGTRQRSDYRINYYRESWLLSYAFRPTPNTRLYAEIDYAIMTGIETKPWHFQFGAEYSPVYPARGEWGTPFAAINTRLMQEHNFDGNFTAQTGWQWRGAHNQLFRIGVQYHGGVSDQYEFIVGRREHKVGLGIWYDF
jgi:hypothetical protein